MDIVIVARSLAKIK